VGAAALLNSFPGQIRILSCAGWVSLIPTGIDQAIVYSCGRVLSKSRDFDSSNYSTLEVSKMLKGRL